MPKSMRLMKCGELCQYFGHCLDGYPQTFKARDKWCDLAKTRISLAELANNYFPEWCPLEEWEKNNENQPLSLDSTTDNETK